MISVIAKLTDLALEGADGRYWYDYAKSKIGEAGKHYGVVDQQLADYLALFSPRVHLRRSVRYALSYLVKGKFEHDVLRNIRASVEHYDLTGEIRGAKTEPFSRALMGDKTAIVLDTWMADALEVDGKKFEVKRVHRAASDKLLTVAEDLDWPVAETQAAIWTAVVRKVRQSVPQLEIPLD